MPILHFLKTSLFVLLCLSGLKAFAIELNSETVEKLKPMLNSERIESIFGNYGIEPYKLCTNYFPQARISNIYSIHSNQKIMRSLAIVDFKQPISPALIAAHNKIIDGASIGRTLRNAGWSIIKKPIYFGEIPLSGKVLKAMNETVPKNAALYIYQLTVMNKEFTDPIPYCRVIEIYSPQYLTQDWIKALYDKEYPLYRKENAAANEILEPLGKCIQEQ